MKLIFAIIILFTQNAYGQMQKFILKEAKLSLQLPNSEWKLIKREEGNPTQYTFKRNPITDSAGRNILSSIIVFIEDASKYNLDVTTYSIAKRLQFKGKGIAVDSTLIPKTNDYPISYLNSILTICRYTDRGLEHVFYMVHIVNNENKGIQIYMDMTKSVSAKYLKEFWQR